MRTICWVMLLLMVVTGARAQGTASETRRAAEDQKAFDDLGAYYADKGKPDVKRTWERLQSADAETRAAAGRYLLALCRQSIEDEVNGRTSLSRYPPGFGQSRDMEAREFRKALVRELSDHAAVAESVPALEWLLEHDVLPEARGAAMEALCKVQTAECDRFLMATLSKPDPQGTVLVRALGEAGRRNLGGLNEQLRALSVHFQSDVRKAARELAQARQGGDLPAFVPEEAVSHFDGTLRDIAAMVYDRIPADAAFVALKETVPASGNRSGYEWATWGWVMREDQTRVRVLNEMASVRDHPKSSTAVTSTTLARRGEALLELRSAEGRDRESTDAVMGLAPHGTLGGQFEPEQIRLPEILMAAWSYVRGDRTTAAAVLLPRMDALDDERWLREIARDMLGNVYDEEMLTTLVDERDYAKTLDLARHLSSSLFDGMSHQPRARKLLEELPARMKEDFITLTLPSPAEWRQLRAGMPRAEQIRYLAERLRLVNVRQHGWPMETEFCDPQRSVPMGGNIYERVDYSRGEAVINPMRELVLMQLEPGDLPTLLPYLGREEYVLGYNAWRPWSPTWHLFQVNELVEELANDAAGERLVSLSEYYGREPEERASYTAKLQMQAKRLPSRWWRAMGDFKALTLIDGIIGGVLAGAAALWLVWRRKRTWHAALGAVALMLAGMAVAWRPAFLAHHTLQWVDCVPVALMAVMAAAWAGRGGRLVSAIVVGIALAAGMAYLCARFDFWGWQTDVLSVGLVLGLIELIFIVRGWGNRSLSVGAMVLIAAAFAMPGALDAYARNRGFMVPPFFRFFDDWYHPMASAALGLGCIMLVLLGWRLQEQAMPKRPPDVQVTG